MEGLAVDRIFVVDFVVESLLKTMQMCFPEPFLHLGQAVCTVLTLRSSLFWWYCLVAGGISVDQPSF